VTRQSEEPLTIRHAFLLTACLVLICSVIGVGTGISATEDITYDGKWWLSANKGQREGFVDGYISCYVADVKGATKFEYTGQMYAPRLTNYLNTHSDEVEKSVEVLLWKMTTPLFAPPKRKHVGNGNPTSGKYGIDGEFWRESPEERLGIIQGFLFCYFKYENTAKGTFSKPASWYVEAISKWFGIDDSKESIDMRKINVQIPDVLFKFHDTK